MVSIQSRSICVHAEPACAPPRAPRRAGRGREVEVRAARRETDLAARGGRGVAGPGGGLLGLPERLTEQLESTAHGWMRGKVLATHSRGGRLRTGR